MIEKKGGTSSAAGRGEPCFMSKSRRNRGLFRRVKSGRQQSDYGAPFYAACAQNGRSSGHDLQTSLKKARMMLQVDLGAEKRKERQAPRGRMPAVQENRARPAEVQQGERQVRQGVGQSSVGSKGLRRLRAAAKCSARETSKLVNSLAADRYLRQIQNRGSELHFA